MVMVVVMVYNHHNLRWHRIRYCEAEGENSSEKKFFHTSRMTRRTDQCRAILTYARKHCFQKHFGT